MPRIAPGPDSMRSLVSGARSLPRRFCSGERHLSYQEVSDALAPFISEPRARRIQDVVASRAGSVAVVVDGLANTGNVAAVMRTAEGLGYLNLHIIGRAIPYKHSSRTTQGAEKWLDVRVWDQTQACTRHLKEAGYRIVATHLDERARPIGDFDFTIPTALVFGNELGGVSAELLEQADATCIVPMSGFAQSFNISVAAATCLYHARADRERRLGRHGDLDDGDRTWLRAAYDYLAVGHAQAILDRLEDG